MLSWLKFTFLTNVNILVKSSIRFILNVSVAKQAQIWKFIKIWKNQLKIIMQHCLNIRYTFGLMLHEFLNDLLQNFD